jgi:hypothetical protein
MDPQELQHIVKKIRIHLETKEDGDLQGQVTATPGTPMLQPSLGKSMRYRRVKLFCENAGMLSISS